MVMKKLTEMESEAQEQFLTEVQLLKSLVHPNVLRFIGNNNNIYWTPEGKVL